MTPRTFDSEFYAVFLLHTTTFTGQETTSQSQVFAKLFPKLGKQFLPTAILSRSTTSHIMRSPAFGSLLSSISARYENTS